MKHKKNFKKRAPALFLALVMVFGILQTTAMAAVTLEAELTCGKEEHTHTPECYGEAELICKQEVVELHTHTDDCYKLVSEQTSELTCTEVERDATEAVVTPAVMDEEGNEITPAVETPADPGHQHSDSCITVKTEMEYKLVCGKEEVESSHEHTAECYDEAKPVCGKDEHTHNTKDCYTAVTYDRLQAALDSEEGEDDEEVVLILNGSELTVDEGKTITVGNGANKKLTIKDKNGADIAGGTIVGSNGNYVITVVEGGTLTLSGSTVITHNATNNYNPANPTKFTPDESKQGGGVEVNGGTFNMEGGEISGNTVTTPTNYFSKEDGGDPAVQWALNSLAKVNGEKFDGITSNGAYRYSYTNSNGGTSYHFYKVDSNGQILLSNGGGDLFKETGNKNDYMETGDYIGVGGGVYVHNNGTFNLSGGEISNNAAHEGGGVFVGHQTGDSLNTRDGSEFNMSGGTVSGNVATSGEGGGVYIRSTGNVSEDGNKITGGNITNNATLGTKDLGGGGIYIESGASLDLTNAIIVDNTAEGLGGGIAACVHGKILICIAEGAIICGNNANGNAHSMGYDSKNPEGSAVGNFVDGYQQWQNDDKFKSYANDIFTAGMADENSSSVIVCNEMLNGISANWTGVGYKLISKSEYDKLMKDPSATVSYFDNYKVTGDTNTYYYQVVPLKATDGKVVVEANRALSLTAATPSADEQDLIVQFANAIQQRVLISGNYSATHGGGIGNNGALNIGVMEDNVITSSTVSNPEIKKDYDTYVGDDKLDPDDERREHLIGDDFDFELLDSTGTVIGEAKNNADGSVPLEFNSDLFKNAQDGETFIFYVRENIPKNTENGPITYDPTVYRVTLTFKVNTEEYTLGKKDPVTIKVQKIELDGGILYEKVSLIQNEDGSFKCDEDGNIICDESLSEKVDGIGFTNTYTKPEEPPKTPPEDPEEPPKTPPEDPEDPPENPPEDPEDPPENPPEDPEDPPRNPPEDPEEPPRTPPEPEEPPRNPPAPEEEIPDEPTPKADMEEEPEEEEEEDVPDDDVPLVDVPKTSDLAAFWYAATALSALGLTILRKKEEE